MPCKMLAIIPSLITFQWTEQGKIIVVGPFGIEGNKRATAEQKEKQLKPRMKRVQVRE